MKTRRRKRGASSARQGPSTEELIAARDAAHKADPSLTPEARKAVEEKREADERAAYFARCSRVRARRV